MEHSCSLLLLCVSFIFARALPPNGTELPKTTTTTSKEGPGGQDGHGPRGVPGGSVLDVSAGL